MEPGGDVDRFLAGHGIGNKQDLMREDHGFHPLQLRHQLFIDLLAAGCVNDGDVARLTASRIHTFLSDRWRIYGQAVGQGRVDRNTNLLGHDPQLIDRGRTIGVSRDEVRRTPELELEIASEFACAGGLARAVQSHQHNDHRRRRGQVQLGILPAEQRHQLDVDDLDDLLRGGETGQHLLSQGLAFDPLDEVLNHAEVDVSLEERQAYFTQGLFHVLFAELAVTAQPAKDGFQFFAERFKHSGQIGSVRF